jgi:putative spermidine/putrescine transport system permease protein
MTSSLAHPPASKPTHTVGAVRRVGVWPAFAVLALFVGLPLLALVWETTQAEAGLWQRLWSDPLFWDAARNSAWLGLTASTVSVVFGALLARSVARLSPGRRQMMLALLGIPLTFSGLVIAYGFILAFGRAGFITNLLAYLGADPAVVGGFIYSAAGLSVAYAYYLIPRVALLLYPLFANLDRRPFDAALTLGATRWRAWVDTDLRELAPSLASVWCLIAAIAMGTYGTALALAGTQVNILPLFIYLKISDGGSDFALAAALSLMLLALCMLVLSLGDWAARGREHHLGH